MNEAQRILRENHVEIDASDHRTPEEIAQALGLIAKIKVTDDETGPWQPTPLPKRPKDSPYLAY